MMVEIIECSAKSSSCFIKSNTIGCCLLTSLPIGRNIFSGQCCYTFFRLRYAVVVSIEVFAAHQGLLYAYVYLRLGAARDIFISFVPI